jgi:glycerophosphoryl diester phosphodiesterase
MAAFEQSVADGALYVETDIRRSKDGELVLMHDATVDRTTNGTGAVESLTLAELQRLDAGSWFGDGFAGQSPMTFNEFVAWVESKPGFGAALEVKAAGVGADVAHAAWQSTARERLAIYSFLPKEIIAAKAAQPRIPCVLLLRLSDDPKNVISWMADCDADGADVPWQWNAIELIAAMRQLGMIIGGGSADGDQAADRLVALGVDMIDTDDPARMIATVARLQGNSAA